MLEGKSVNLRVLERDDIDFMVDCFNSIDFWGDNPYWEQISKSERTKDFDNPRAEEFYYSEEGWNQNWDCLTYD